LVETIAKGEAGFAARYAAALYELAFEHGVLDRVIDEMTGLGQLLAEKDGLGRLVNDRLANAASVAPVVQQALAAEGFSAIVQNFVNVAIANRRLRDLPALVAGFAAYVAGKRGEVVGYVTSAHPLSDLQRAQLHARVTQSGYGNVRLLETIDPALLGGMTLKIGPKLYDTSLKSRLERLTYALKGAA
jgi:F-type H+-transporting ATPase subunit delta